MVVPGEDPLPVQGNRLRNRRDDLGAQLPGLLDPPVDEVGGLLLGGLVPEQSEVLLEQVGLVQQFVGREQLVEPGLFLGRLLEVLLGPQ